MLAMHQAEKKHLYVYTSGVAEYYNYELQFEDGFKSSPFFADVQVKYFAYSDHTYILHAQRQQLFSLMLSWIEKQSSNTHVRP